MHIAKEEEGTKRGEGGVDVANFGEVCSLRGGATGCSFPGIDRKIQYIDGIDRTQRRRGFV